MILYFIDTYEKNIIMNWHKNIENIAETAKF